MVRTLPPLLLTGRNAWYYAQRNGVADGTLLCRAGKDGDVDYSASVPFEEWMNGSSLVFRAQDLSCCGDEPKAPVFVPVAEMDFTPPVFNPVFRLTPISSTGVKTRNLSGRAYVNFPVNRTEIYPDYMNNPAELRKIIETIDKVRLDRDATVDSIFLTGYASPEGPYSNNVRLAKGRTEAVKQYVMKQYDFPAGVYFTASTPEDWAGLREYVEGSVLADRRQILDFIDDTSVPIEKKNDRLRALFPASYAYLLKNVYPSLRHTDYRIHYQIRHYTTLDEIREAYRTNPANLDLGEFYVLASSYPSGSAESVEVLEKAVELNPSSPAANINAAMAMMQADRMDSASHYLDKAGSSPEAEYARGLLAAIRKDNDKAAGHFSRAAEAGVPEASEALKQIEGIRNHAASGVKYID